MVILTYSRNAVYSLKKYIYSAW